MSAEALEAPGSPSELYLASSPAEVEQARPYMTGDVFDGITIPGLSPESEGLGIVLTHPCSMRADGVRPQRRSVVRRAMRHHLAYG
ncbi:hypothetical protein [Candidatus Poriferisodalis sp.]|uniref:hypothetical protein n=1 Tax=Candidatus Poriferisodalis sp. TaxID=3101277 RepID=UPI003B52CEFB